MKNPIKTPNKIRISTILIIASIISFLIFAMSFTNFNNAETYQYNFPNDTARISYFYSSCSNLSIANFSKCIISKNKLLFKYNITPDYKKLSFMDLLLYGGDCRDWSLLYQDIGHEFGYYATTTAFKINNSLSHRVAFISNPEGYCLIDQLGHYCYVIPKKLNT